MITFAGFVLTATFVACAAVALFAVGEVVRDNEQGGRVLAGATYATGRPLPVLRTGTAAIRRPPPGYVGRHRG